MATKTQDVVAGIDVTMKQLRAAMRGIQIRRAGFKADHDNLARAVANLTVTLLDAQALLIGTEHVKRRRR